MLFSSEGSCGQGLLTLLVSVSMESFYGSLFLSSPCYSTVMCVLRVFFASILLGERIHTLVLPFKTYTYDH